MQIQLLQRYFLLLTIILCCTKLTAQPAVSINTTGAPPNSSSILDISSTTKGVLIPRMNNFQMTNIGSPAKGLMVYQTDLDSGLHYYTGAKWVLLAAVDTSTKSAWLLGGNAFTNPNTHFIGNIDNTPLLFRVNNLPSGGMGYNANTSFGQSSMGYNKGGQNSAFGYSALQGITTGQSNSGFGAYALAVNSNGNFNTASGYDALNFNSTGDNNVAIGYRASYESFTSNNNTAVGSYALSVNDASNNCAFGFESLKTNTAGYELASFGYQSLANNTANYNSAFGYQALAANTTGASNFAAGDKALDNNTVGNVNTAIGNNALGINLTGDDNTAVGANALDVNFAGSFNTALGFNANVGSNSLLNATAIGYATIVNLGNKMRLGNANTALVETQNAFTVVSDGRFKTNITEEVKGLDFIKRLRPVMYNFDTKKFDRFLMQNMPDSIKERMLSSTDYSVSTSIRQTGFIAQEVEAAAKASGYNFNGLHIPENSNDNYSLSYEKFVVPLVKGMQEQQLIIESQNKKIEDQEKNIQLLLKEMAELKKKLN